MSAKKNAVAKKNEAKALAAAAARAAAAVDCAKTDAKRIRMRAAREPAPLLRDLKDAPCTVCTGREFVETLDGRQVCKACFGRHGTGWTGRIVDRAIIEDDGFGHVIVTEIKPAREALAEAPAAKWDGHSFNACEETLLCPQHRGRVRKSGPVYSVAHEVVAAANASGEQWDIADLQVALRFRADGGSYWLANLGRTGADGGSAIDALTALRDQLRQHYAATTINGGA
jgi:hypothetical protein